MLLWLLVLIPVFIGVAIVSWWMITSQKQKWSKTTLLENEGQWVDIAEDKLVVADEPNKSVNLYTVDTDTWELVFQNPIATTDKSDEENTKFGYKAVTNGTDFAASCDLNNESPYVELYTEGNTKVTTFENSWDYSLFGYGLKFIDNNLIIGANNEQTNNGAWYWYIVDSNEPNTPILADHGDNEYLGRCIDTVKVQDSKYILAVGGENTDIKIYSIDLAAEAKLEKTLAITITETDSQGFATHLQLSADGTKLVTGAIGTNEVWVYDLDLDKQEYSMVGEVITTDEPGYFGSSVGISKDGSTIAVGAKHWKTSEDDTEYSGYIRVYDWTGTEWTQRGDTLYGSPQDMLGRRLVLHGDGAILLATRHGGGVDRYVWG